MKKAVFCTIILSVGIYLLGVLPATAAPSYTCKVLPTLANRVMLASCINNAGQVAGSLEGPSHAFLYDGVVTQDLGTLPAPYDGLSQANGINDAGQVVGNSQTVGWPPVSHAFFFGTGGISELGSPPSPNAGWSAQSSNNMGKAAGWWKNSSGYSQASKFSRGPDPMWKNLGTLGGANSMAYGINDTGQVVGAADTSSGARHAFLYSGDVMQPLGTLPAPYDYESRAVAINAIGQVVGYSSSSSYVSRAFLYSSGVMQPLGTLPAPYDYKSRAVAINATGQVVGYCYSSSNVARAFLYSGGVMLDLTGLVKNLPAGVVLAEAMGINDRGQIVANGFDGHAYILTPCQALPALELLLE